METNTLEKITIMKAFLEGQSIDVKSKMHAYQPWLPCLNPVWDWSGCDYRIKPNPQVTYEEQDILVPTWDRNSTLIVHARYAVEKGVKTLISYNFIN